MKRWPITCALIVLSLFMLACGPQAKTAAKKGPAAPKGTPFPVNFDPKNFDETSTTIDNPWLPLKPGRQLTWQGQALDGEDVVQRKIVFTVTDLTKEIGGVRTLVGWDRDFNNGRLVEPELIFLAQDKEGNVWHFGQYAEQYSDEGEYDGAIGWIVGYLQGAKAGILMQADPKPGTPKYSEGFAPAPFYWDDEAKVSKVGQKTCVKAGCYSGVMIIEESEPLKPDAFQLKYYAKGVGNVRTGWRGENEEEQETLELVKIGQLDAAGMAQARAAALKIDARGNVYGMTEPLRQLVAAAASPTP
jgi:hypothetical protein